MLMCACMCVCKIHADNYLSLNHWREELTPSPVMSLVDTHTAASKRLRLFLVSVASRSTMMSKCGRLSFVTKTPFGSRRYL